jgi:hypothetical protein
MKLRCLSLFLALGVCAGTVSYAEATRKTGLTVLAKYEGGTLPMTPGRIRATVAEDQIVILHGSRKMSIPLKNITAITCNTDVRRRFGASVLGMVPLMHLDKAETHYIGLSWTGDAAGEKTSRAEIVLRMTSAEYRDFLAVMERLAGIKVVNADKVPTVVRYEI